MPVVWSYTQCINSRKHSCLKGCDFFLSWRLIHPFALVLPVSITIYLPSTGNFKAQTGSLITLSSNLFMLWLNSVSDHFPWARRIRQWAPHPVRPTTTVISPGAGSLSSLAYLKVLNMQPLTERAVNHWRYQDLGFIAAGLWCLKIEKESSVPMQAIMGSQTFTRAIRLTVVS